MKKKTLLPLIAASLVGCAAPLCKETAVTFKLVGDDNYYPGKLRTYGHGVPTDADLAAMVRTSVPSKAGEEVSSWSALGPEWRNGKPVACSAGR